MSYEIQAATPTQCVSQTLTWRGPAEVTKGIGVWVQDTVRRFFCTPCAQMLRPKDTDWRMQDYFAEFVRDNLTGTLGTLDWVCGSSLAPLPRRPAPADHTSLRLPRRRLDWLSDLQSPECERLRDAGLPPSPARHDGRVSAPKPGTNGDGLDGCPREQSLEREPAAVHICIVSLRAFHQGRALADIPALGPAESLADAPMSG